MQVVNWWDGAGSPTQEAAARPLRAPELEAQLEACGWEPLGLLGLWLDARHRHPRAKLSTKAMWRSPDGATVARVCRSFGRGDVELYSLMTDGMVLHTQWNEGGALLEPFGRAPDPAEPAPGGLVWVPHRAMARSGLVHGDPCAGVQIRLAGDVDLQTSLAAHAQWVRASEQRHGGPVRQDLEAAAAARVHVGAALARDREFPAAMASFALLVVVASVLGAAAAHLAPVLQDLIPWLPLGVERRAGRGMMGWSLTFAMMCGDLMVTIGGYIRRVLVNPMLALYATFLVLSSGWAMGLGSVLGWSIVRELFPPGALLAGAIGAVLGASWGYFGHDRLVTWMLAAVPGTGRPTAVQIIARYGAPYRIPAPGLEAMAAAGS